ncbi:TonB-dependent siderophore receptor [Radicibacter daui]|uniref:TonB-dependent siderophore receptor n=1 Tax=Radicibacter daui TaxID=3064829 RepID=UPI004046AB12
MSSSALLAAPQALAQAATDDNAEAVVLSPVVVTDERESAVGPDTSIVAKNTRTSSKTDTPLLDAPASVSIVTEKELEERGVKTLDQALSYTPGVYTDVYGSDNRYDHYLIRGFYSTGLSTYLDGLPMRGNNFTTGRMETYGLQRLEVLKGANSTLFGLSQPGGIANAISKRPQQDLSFGEAYTTVGENSHVETGTDFGAPLDKAGIWSYRVVGKWQDAEQGIEESRDDRVYLAPSLRYSPSVDTDVTVLTSYNKRNGSTSHGIPYGSGIDPDTYLGEPDFDRMDTLERNVGYEVRHNLGNGFELRQNARFTDLDVTYDSVYAGSSGVSAGRSALAIDGNAKRFDIDNQLQYDRSFSIFDSKTLAGLSYEHDDLSEHRRDGTLAGIDIDDPTYVGVGGITFTSDSQTDATQTIRSSYLQEELTVARQWIVTLGGRYDHVDTHSYTVADYGSGDTVTDVSAIDEAFTSRAGLTYKVTDELSVYTNYSQSFQPMDANRSLLVGSAKPQEGEQYEVGTKFEPEGLDALFTLSLFDLTQKNVAQYNSSYTAQYQVGEINVRGVEFESKFALTDRLDLIGSYAYWDAEIKDDVDTSLIGNRPETVPTNVASLWASYTVPGNDPVGDLTFGFGGRYVDGLYGDNANTVELPSRIVFDAAVTYKITENASFSVNATNLFDRVYVTDVDTYSNTAFYGDRREVLATLRYTW